MPATQSQIVTWSLTAGDPPPVEVFNPTGRSNVIFLCDHGSNVIPQALNGLGLSEHLQRRHIAWDVGALEVARQLASRCDAPMIKSGYSRLVIDPNRFPGDPQSIPRISDGFEIPGNQNLGEAETRYRSAAFFKPYHRAIDKRIRHLRERGLVPALVSIHSFTPALSCNTPRPWHIGVVWNRDPRIAKPLIARLQRLPGVCVGDNKPYHANSPRGFTLSVHAEQPGYPHVLIEIRKDLVNHREGVNYWAGVLWEALEEIFADHTIYRIEHYKK
ncbi:MAG: N-formylglutamate amidohydrolase [Chromatiaceae bacterium]|nr:N-formylglutamate amidohydrolase [Chromatiaceae bacterium]